MLLKEIYQLFIQMGKEQDPRLPEEVERTLNLAKQRYEELKEQEKQFFDEESVFNPYSDTRILWGDPQTPVKTVLAGIDVETGEVLLADRMREKGEQIDLLLSHHPEGKALVSLYRVMEMQEDILAAAGVPINIAEGILASRISEVKRGLMPLNHNRAVDAARLLEVPFMCVHTPADNMVTGFLNKAFAEKEPATVDDVVKILKEIPEYQAAQQMGAGPAIIAGKEKRRAGKILVDMTGGTSGSEDAYARLATAGVGTIVGMHMGEKHRKEAEKNHLNVVIAGHMASDSLGMNLLLDALEQQGVVVLTCSGLTRYRRS